jgi:hypothetical protein
MLGVDKREMRESLGGGFHGEFAGLHASEYFLNAVVRHARRISVRLDRTERPSRSS